MNWLEKRKIKKEFNEKIKAQEAKMKNIMEPYEKKYNSYYNAYAKKCEIRMKKKEIRQHNITIVLHSISPEKVGQFVMDATLIIIKMLVALALKDKTTKELAF